MTGPSALMLLFLYPSFKPSSCSRTSSTWKENHDNISQEDNSLRSWRLCVDGVANTSGVEPRGEWEEKMWETACWNSRGSPRGFAAQSFKTHKKTAATQATKINQIFLGAIKVISSITVSVCWFCCWKDSRHLCALALRRRERFICKWKVDLQQVYIFNNW